MFEGMSESSTKYQGFADDIHSTYNDFNKNDLFHGTAATALKLFVVGGTGRMLTEITDIHKQMLHDQEYLITSFETMVDASPVARIEYDTLDVINTDFKGYSSIFNGIAGEVEIIVRNLNNEFGGYDSFPQPKSKDAKAGFITMCGGEGSGGFLKACQDKFLSFDHEVTTYLKGRDTTDHCDNIDSRITNSAGVMAGSDEYQHQSDKYKALKTAKPAWQTLANAFNSYCDSIKAEFKIRSSSNNGMHGFLGTLENMQDSFIAGSFGAFESIDNSLVKKITSSGFYTVYKNIVKENIVDANYYEDPARHGLTAASQALSKLGEGVGNLLKKGVDAAVGIMPDDPSCYWTNPASGFWLFQAAGAIESYVKDGNIHNANNYAVGNFKRFEKGGLYCLADMVGGIFSLPELLVNAQFAKQDAISGSTDYLLHNGVKNLPNDLKVWAGDKASQMGALWGHAQGEFIDKFTNEDGTVDIGQCYESAGYLTVFIASFFVGAGEAKSASAAGEAGSKAANATSKVVKLTETPLDELARVAETPIDEAAKAVAETEKVAKEAETVAKAQFASEEKLLSHFDKHGGEFKGAFNSADEYLAGAQEVMQKGYKVEYLYKGETRTGYVEFMGNNSKGNAKFAFVGTNNEGYITTFHTESGKTFWKMLNGDNIPVIKPK